MVDETYITLPEQLLAIAVGPVECLQCGRERDTDGWSVCVSTFGCGYIPGLSKTAPAAAKVLIESAELIEEMETIFDLRWSADMRAIKRWQTANPGNDLTWPDHADLVVWLMDQLDGLRIIKEDRDGA